MNTPTYSIPEPPPNDVMAVVDRQGRIYYRAGQIGDYWYNETDPAVRGTYAWHDLLFQRGPVSEA